MKKWKVLIVEDDSVILRRMKTLIEMDLEIDIIAEARTAQEFHSLIEKRLPDFVICDIDLPDADGIQIAQATLEKGLSIPFIFVTGLAQFAADSYLVNTVDYILKPIQQARLQQGLDKVKKRLQENIRMDSSIKDPSGSLGKLSVKKEDGFAFLDTDSIVLIRKEGKKTAIIALLQSEGSLSPTVYLTNQSMKELIEKLEPYNFIRSHNSFIVNLKWIKEVVHYSSDSYKVKFHHVQEYALLNRDKLSQLIDQMD